MTKIPTDVPERLEFYGTTIFGAKCWRGKLAAGLSIAPSTLRLWLNGEYKSDRDIDGEVLDLIERERDVSAERNVELGELRKRILKSSDRSRYDAL